MSTSRYVAENVTMSEGWREADNGVLFDLHHRPLHLIQHMRNASMTATPIMKIMTSQIGEGTFKVRSLSQPSIEHTVVLCGEANQPSCSCFAFRNTHLLCKHFAAIFQHYNLTWNALPAS